MGGDSDVVRSDGQIGAVSFGRGRRRQRLGWNSTPGMGKRRDVGGR